MNKTGLFAALLIVNSLAEAGTQNNPFEPVDVNINLGQTPYGVTNNGTKR